MSSCEMCGSKKPRPLVPLRNLTQDELEVLDLLFTSDPDLSLTWEEIPPSSVFCSGCVNLLRQMKALNDKLKVLSTQMDDVVLKVKSNYEAKLEKNNTPLVDLSDNEDSKNVIDLTLSSGSDEDYRNSECSSSDDSSDDDPDFSYSNFNNRKASPKSQQKPSGLQCRFCSFSSTSNNEVDLLGIRQHERKEHAQKFIRICKTCHSTFVDLKEVRTCQESHRSTGEANGFMCFVCDTRFKDGSSLLEHLQIKHTKGGHQCTQCDKVFHNTPLLNIHVRQVHSITGSHASSSDTYHQNKSNCTEGPSGNLIYNACSPSDSDSED